MSTTTSRLQNDYLIDILDQPEALRRSIRGLEKSRDLLSFAEKLQRGGYRRVVLTGMGSSYFALYPLQLQLLAQGMAAFMVETSELVHYMPDLLKPETLLIVVSQSGRSAEVVRLLEQIRGRVQAIAVTNDESSPLAAAASACVLIRAGKEASVSCKTYVSSLQALEWLGTTLLGGDTEALRDELMESAAAVEKYLSGWELHIDELLGYLADTAHLFITGRGPSLAAAGTGGLILKESVRFPAEGMSCAAFRHGPFEMLHRRVLVLVFGGDARTLDINRRLAADVRATGAAAMMIDAEAEQAALLLPLGPARMRPVLEILPVQMISLALAARDGLDAGRFERASKVTTVE